MPSNGEMRMKDTVLMIPPEIRAEGPVLAKAAPIKPPINACDDDEGIP